MEDYGFVVDELLGTKPQQPAQQQPKEDYGYVVDELLGLKSTSDLPQPAQTAQPIPLGVQNTGKVSTITSKPIMEASGEAPTQASFGTLAKVALVEDPRTKIRLFAEARGIPVSRYGITRDGQIVFKDDSGQLRYEDQSNTGSDKLKGLAATVAGNPSIPLSTVGAALGGSPGAIAGAMGGETIRQGIAGLAFDDPQTAKGNLLNLGTEGIVGALSELGGKGIMKTVNKALGIGNPEGRALAEAAKRDFPHIQAAEVRRVYDLGQDFGIDLFPAQTTKSQQLIAKMNLLRDLPQTSDVIQAADKVQNEQIQGAIPRFLDRISPPGVTSRDVGEQVSNLAEDAIKGLKADRAAVAGPIYKAAFEENPQVDLTNVMQFLDDKIKYARGDELRALEKLKSDIVGPEDSEPSLQAMHSMKVYLDKRIAQLGKPSSPSIDNIIGGEMKQTRSLLLDAMDNAGENIASDIETKEPLSRYKLARQTYALMSPEVERAEKGLVGVLAGADEKNLANVSSVLLASRYTRPETVAAVKAEILKQPNGEAVWNMATRDYLEQVFDNITDSQVNSLTNIGGAFRKHIFGNTKQREIMFEALGPEKYQIMNDFMTVLQRTGLTFQRESTTAIRQQALQDMKADAESGVVTLLTQPLQSPKKLLGDRINEVLYSRGAEKLAAALTSETAAEQLLQLKRLPKGSEELIKGVAQFLETTKAEPVQNDAVNFMMGR